MVAPASVDAEHGDDDAGDAEAFPLDVEDEYDPMQPNDYELVQRERAAQTAHDLALVRDAEDRDARNAAAAGSAVAMGRGRGMDILPAWMTKSAGAVAPAHATSGAGGFAAGASSMPHPSGAALAEARPSAAAAQPTAGLGARLLAKWGYAVGKGLGKDEDGITAPLVHEKTGRAHGVIRVAERIPLLDANPLPSGQPSAPSRIVMLRNMVGAGDVDDTLEDEVRDECSKYGAVDAVYIWERPAGPVATTTTTATDDDAIRIIVAFTNTAAAERARVDLHGRFFGGRSVRASFIDEARFKGLDFAPRAEDSL